MLPPHHICERARLSRDPRFDGAFFIGVVTTGIYCRPVCPVRQPAEDNVRYYPSAAAAEEAGFRPCLRCLPEAAARVPEWRIGSRAVIQGLRLIDSGLLEDPGTEALAARLGISSRHLNRLFHRELGATPRALALTRRRALAKRLIDETRLPFARVAEQAGYGSLRRFNDDLKRRYGRAPRDLRRGRRRRRSEAAAGNAAPDAFTLRLPVRAPYDAAWVFEFLARRALSGFEVVEGHRYRRRVMDESGRDHWVTVAWNGEALELTVPVACRVPLSDLLVRVRRVFDLDADPIAIAADLGADPLLAPLIQACPGLRVPGAWNGFETAVRAILGQQVSVARATDLAQRLLDRYGQDCLVRPPALAAATPAEIGMPGRRGAAISLLAEAVAGGDVDLEDGAADDLQSRLCAIPGIGPWTAGYVAMRVTRDPDAYPVNDWVVLKMLEAELDQGDAGDPGGAGGRAAIRAAAAGRAGSRADHWRPWRAYAVMYLWKLADLRRRAEARREAS